MIAIIIICITCVVSIFAFNNKELFDILSFRPYQVIHKKEYYRLITNGFIHANWEHLFTNMLVLYFFGPYQEALFGSIGYIVFYILAIPAADMYCLYKYKDDPHYSAIGASGAVNAVLFSFIMMHPWSTIDIFFAIPVKSIFFAALYLTYSTYMAKKNMDNIGHEAHISGALFGILFTILIVPNAIDTFIYKLMN